MPTATPEELSNQRRSKKSGDGAETKKTELEVLQRQRNKGMKDWESGGRGSVTCLSLLVKDKLPHNREVHVNVKEWQLKPQRREGERKKITADEHQQAQKLGSWNPLRERKKITADENQPAWKVGSCTPRKEKDIADEHQPAKQVGSWEPEERERRLQRMNTNQHERLTVEIHLNLSFLYPRETGSNDAERTPWSKLSNPWFHPRRIINLLYFGCG